MLGFFKRKNYNEDLIQSVLEEVTGSGISEEVIKNFVKYAKKRRPKKCLSARRS